MRHRAGDRARLASTQLHSVDRSALVFHSDLGCGALVVRCDVGGPRLGRHDCCYLFVDVVQFAGEPLLGLGKGVLEERVAACLLLALLRLVPREKAAFDVARYFAVLLLLAVCLATP